MGAPYFALVGYEDLAGRLLPNGLRVVRRVSSQPLKWLCKCEKCGSEMCFSHQRVKAALSGATGNVAQCSSNCRLFGTATKPEPSTPRPDHTQDIERQPKAVDPAPVPLPKPKPVPPDPLQKDYNRFVVAQKAWGHEHVSFAEFKHTKEMFPEFIEDIMRQVSEYEAEKAKQHEAEKLGEQLQRQWEDEFFNRYDIRVATNLGGNK